MKSKAINLLVAGLASLALIGCDQEEAAPEPAPPPAPEAAPPPPPEPPPPEPTPPAP